MTPCSPLCHRRLRREALRIPSQAKGSLLHRLPVKGSLLHRLRWDPPSTAMGSLSAMGSFLLKGAFGARGNGLFKGIFFSRGLLVYLQNESQRGDLSCQHFVRRFDFRISCDQIRLQKWTTVKSHRRLPIDGQREPWGEWDGGALWGPWGAFQSDYVARHHPGGPPGRARGGPGV